MTIFLYFKIKIIFSFFSTVRLNNRTNRTNLSKEKCRKITYFYVQIWNDIEKKKKIKKIYYTYIGFICFVASHACEVDVRNASQISPNGLCTILSKVLQRALSGSIYKKKEY